MHRALLIVCVLGAVAACVALDAQTSTSGCLSKNDDDCPPATGPTVPEPAVRGQGLGNLAVVVNHNSGVVDPALQAALRARLTRKKDPKDEQIAMLKDRLTEDEAQLASLRIQAAQRTAIEQVKQQQAVQKLLRSKDLYGNPNTRDGKAPKRKGSGQGSDDGPEWDYIAGGGDWPMGSCKSGAKQSPVEIPLKGANLQVATAGGPGSKADRALIFNWADGKTAGKGFALRNNGHFLQVDANDGNLGNVMFNGVKYVVKSLEFHSPSEHLLEHHSFPLELQIMHQKEGAEGDEGMLAVAVWFKIGSQDNPLLKALDMEHAPAEPEAFVPAKHDLALNYTGATAKNKYYVYAGSMTHPPCTESVNWFVLDTPTLITSKTASAIAKIFSGNRKFAKGRGNNRQVQRLGSRKVVYTPASAAGSSFLVKQLHQ